MSDTYTVFYSAGNTFYRSWWSLILALRPALAAHPEQKFPNFWVYSTVPGIQEPQDTQKGLGYVSEEYLSL